MNDKIKALRAELDELNARRRAVADQLRAAQLEVAPFKPGDVVEARMWRQGGFKWLPAQVVEARPSWGDKYEYKVSPFNKDGNVSRRVVRVFDGEVRQPE